MARAKEGMSVKYDPRPTYHQKHEPRDCAAPEPRMFSFGLAEGRGGSMEIPVEDFLPALPEERKV